MFLSEQLQQVLRSSQVVVEDRTRNTQEIANQPIAHAVTHRDAFLASDDHVVRAEYAQLL